MCNPFFTAFSSATDFFSIDSFNGVFVRIHWVLSGYNFSKPLQIVYVTHSTAKFKHFEYSKMNQSSKEQLLWHTEQRRNDSVCKKVSSFYIRHGLNYFFYNSMSKHDDLSHAYILTLSYAFLAYLNISVCHQCVTNDFDFHHLHFMLH